MPETVSIGRARAADQSRAPSPTATSEMLRSLLLLIVCVGLALLCVTRAIARDAFSLWDAGYYLSALGALLALGRVLERGRTDPGGAS